MDAHVDRCYTSGMQTPSRQSALGRARGSFILAGFGTAWLLLGLDAMHRLSWQRALACALPGTAIVATAVVLRQRARTLPEGHWTATQIARAKRLFKLANLAQWIAIPVAIVLLNLMHRPEFIAPVIGIIVGLHFFPMAVGFRQKQNYLTGALLVAWNIGCMLLLAGERLSGVSSFGNGLVLLVSIAVTLAIALGQIRFREPALQAPGS